MDQQHDSKVVRWFCAAAAIPAVCMVAAAVILDVGKDKTPSVTVMAPQQPQLQPSGASVVYLSVSDLRARQRSHRSGSRHRAGTYLYGEGSAAT